MNFISRRIISFLFFLALAASASAGEMRTLTLPVAPGMSRARLRYYAPPKDCAGALVLCPGWNGDGAHLIRDARWQELARKHKLVLVGLDFAASEAEGEQSGYHHTEKGSGRLLFEGLHKIVKKDVPLTLFGFSRGGQFVNSLAARHPERVRVWCCTGSALTEEFPAGAKVKPPGVVACGLKDGNTSSSLSLFFSGLRARWRVCWLGVPNSGHTIEPRAAAWVREFFDAVLSAPADVSGVWTESEERGLEGFLVRSWCPDEKTKKTWEAFR
jgi:pimeloyl-ACP methyl ester carboxylesterase